MAENSPIEWCEHSHNGWWGCTAVGPPCENCYAEAWAKRCGFDVFGSGKPRRLMSDKNWDLPLKWDREAAVGLANGTLVRPPRVFPNSMSDFFDNEVPDAWRTRYWDLMRKTPNLDWLPLTKRIGNVRKMLPPDWGDGWPNVVLMATMANQEEWDRDAPKLRATPALRRGVSIEPMLGPIDMRLMDSAIGFPAHIDRLGHAHGLPHWLNWVICGGESGPNARPMHPAWARALRDQCAAAGVPFLFKQWGEFADLTDATPELMRTSTEDNIFTSTGRTLGAGYRQGRKSMGMVEENWREQGGAWMGRVGKKRAGRLLDGVTHDGYCERMAA